MSNVLKNAVVISFITLVSRVLGYLRDLVIASFLGTGALNDAFIAAFKFTNLFRNIFGEGALTAAFTPLFVHQLSAEGKSSAIAMAAAVHSILVLSLLAFTCCVIACMPLVLDLTTPGFQASEEMFLLAVDLGRITFPYLLFVSLAAFYGSILHSIGKFMPFAATAIIFNISMILFTFYCNAGATKAHTASYGVLAAGVLELLWMLFFLKRYCMMLPIVLPKLTINVRVLLKRLGTGILGSGIAQINVWIDMIIASLISGGMSYMYYAERIMQLPLALVATASSTALLPSLAKYLAENDKLKASNIKDKMLSVNGFFLIPSALVFFAFAEDIVRILLERGLFDAESTRKTAAALKILALGIPAFAIIKLFNSIFHARGDTKTPAQLAGIALILNVLVSVTLLHLLEHVAIAIASVTAAWFIAIALVYLTISREYYIPSRVVIYNTITYTAAALAGLFCTKILINKVDLIPSLVLGGVLYIALCFFQRKILMWRR